jgi:hypothetical protein
LQGQAEEEEGTVAAEGARISVVVEAAEVASAVAEVAFEAAVARASAAAREAI